MCFLMVTGSILKPPQLSVHGLWIDISIKHPLVSSSRDMWQWAFSWRTLGAINLHYIELFIIIYILAMLQHSGLVWMRQYNINILPSLVSWCNYAINELHTFWIRFAILKLLTMISCGQIQLLHCLIWCYTPEFCALVDPFFSALVLSLPNP